MKPEVNQRKQSPPLVGTKMDHYEILSLVGAGGMGEVYRARDSRLGREVAIKVLPSLDSTDTDRLRRFEQEARAAGMLNHPNILTLHDVGTHEGSPYIITELLEGETLRTRMKGKSLPLDRVMDYAMQIARGLAAAHDRHIVHRDLKPENLFITLDGRVKILDFGLAKLKPQWEGAGTETKASTESLYTAPGVLLGTVGYMSPEQVRGKEVDHRSDIFAFGAVLYEMLAGRRAFQGDSAIEVMNAILKEEPPEMGERGREVTPALARVVKHCLEKNPADRFQSIGDAAFYLDTLVRTADSTAVASAVTPKPTGRFALRVAAAIGLVALGALVGVSWLLFRSRPSDLLGYRFTPLATGAGLEILPSWSPNGKTIAYSGEVDGVFQIFTRTLGSAMSAQITSHHDDCLDSFWSPDGALIYFISEGKEKSDLWRVGAAGGSPELVIENAARATISPDGKVVAFFRSAQRSAQADNTLWFSSPPGARPVRYTEPPIGSKSFNYQSYLRFSPDGSRIGAFLSLWGYSKREFWIIPFPNGAPRETLTNRPPSAPAVAFSWMPDSRHVAFAREGQLWKGDTQNNVISRLTASAQQETSPAVSPDGSRLALEVTERGYDLVEVPLDGSGMRDLLATPRSELTPSWSPDGNQYIYVTDRNGAAEIWLKSRREGWERPLLTQNDFGPDQTLELFDPSFSPDGRRFAYRRAGAAGEAIWISTTAGDPPVRLTPGIVDPMQRGPAWSPDGNWIAYFTVREGKRTVMKARVGRVAPPEVVSAEVGAYPRWSPNGDWIACATVAPGLTLTSLDGKVVRVLSHHLWLAHGWSKDGSRIYGLRQTENRRLVLADVDIHNGNEKVLADLGLYPASFTIAAVSVRGFSLAADGKSFITSMYRARSDIWMLEGLPN